MEAILLVSVMIVWAKLQEAVDRKKAEEKYQYEREQIAAEMHQEQL